MTLKTLGWNSFFEEAFAPHRKEEFCPARVAVQHKTHYIVYTEYGELRGEVTGKMHYLAEGPHDFPAVGDWTVIHPRPEENAATIHEILPRKSSFSRKVAGTRTEEQILAANIDIVFIVSGLDDDFNIRRLERYMVVAADSGARPVVILNKADICENAEERKREVDAIARGTPVHILSALHDTGLDIVLSYLKPGITGALLGSSGVGKSTIINHLLGQELLPTKEVRAADSRGRHTTTRRELLVLPQGGLLIDTPGLRELQLWSDGESIGNVFDDIRRLADRCRFRDCTHSAEPGCAVQAAIQDGSLDESRFLSFQKLQKEVAYLRRKSDQEEQRKEKERVKRISKQIKQIYKTRKKRS